MKQILGYVVLLVVLIAIQTNSYSIITAQRYIK